MADSDGALVWLDSFVWHSAAHSMARRAYPSCMWHTTPSAALGGHAHGGLVGRASVGDRYGRDGVQGTDPAALALVKALDAGDAFTFAGVYTHGGHSYDARGSVAIRAVAEQEAAAVVQFSKLLRAHGVECPVVRLCFASLCLLRRPSVGCACMRMRMRMGAVAGWGVVTVSMRLSDACWYVRKDVHGCVGIP
eukprot:m.1301661 g.1301661  ORF g.1301661 m.1301661 type:complete len:193 (-) comp24806_c0_seq12:472-1050(-)